MYIEYRPMKISFIPYIQFNIRYKFIIYIYDTRSEIKNGLQYWMALLSQEVVL